MPDVTNCGCPITLGNTLYVVFDQPLTEEGTTTVELTLIPAAYFLWQGYLGRVPAFGTARYLISFYCTNNEPCDDFILDIHHVNDPLTRLQETATAGVVTCDPFDYLSYMQVILSDLDATHVCRENVNYYLTAHVVETV